MNSALATVKIVSVCILFSINNIIELFGLLRDDDFDFDSDDMDSTSDIEYVF